MISIITIVKNDHGLKDTLAKVTSLSPPDKTEIIIVDASHGNLDYIRDQFPQVKWIPYTVKKNKVTIPEQRNVGIKAAKGDVIVFIDANCIPEDNWLKELYKSHQEGENIVCGPVVATNHETTININVPRESQATYLDECATINVLFSRKVMNAVGEFDESLEGGEDVDFTWRAVQKGFKIRFNNKAVVSHDWGTFGDEVKRSYRYGKSKVKLLKKYPDKIKPYIRTNYIELIYMLYILFIPVSLFFHYYILLVPLFIFNNYRERNPVKFVILRFAFAYGLLIGIVDF